jgi:hypothetical protein
MLLPCIVYTQQFKKKLKYPSVIGLTRFIDFASRKQQTHVGMSRALSASVIVTNAGVAWIVVGQPHILEQEYPQHFKVVERD